MVDLVTKTLSLINLFSFFFPDGMTGEELEVRYQNENRLIKQIFTGYDGTHPDDNLPVRVIPILSIDHIRAMDEQHQTVIIHSTFVFSWSDQRLSWNATQFGNIRKITRSKTLFNGRKLWTPQLYITDLYTSTENLMTISDTSDVTISSSGNVRIQLKLQIKTACFFEFGDYPNDFQNCTFNLYSPYDASEFQFARWGGVEWVKYTMSGEEYIPQVDVLDYKLVDTESEGFFIVLGNNVVKNYGDTNPKMARSFFRYNLIFKRNNVYYQTRMAIPMICAAVLLAVSGIMRGFTGVAWLFISLFYQLFIMIELTESLPPDYNEVPMIGKIGFMLLVETCVLLGWRTFTIYVKNRRNSVKEIQKRELYVTPPNIATLIDIANIGDGILIVLLLVQLILNIMILW